MQYKKKKEIKKFNKVLDDLSPSMIKKLRKRLEKKLKKAEEKLW